MAPHAPSADHCSRGAAFASATSTDGGRSIACSIRDEAGPSSSPRTRTHSPRPAGEYSTSKSTVFRPRVPSRATVASPAGNVTSTLISSAPSAVVRTWKPADSSRLTLSGSSSTALGKSEMGVSVLSPARTSSSTSSNSPIGVSPMRMSEISSGP